MVANAAVIDTLRVEIRADLDRFEADLRSVKAEVRRASDESSRGFASVRRSVDDAAGALRTMRGIVGGVAAVLGAREAFGLARQALDVADSLDRMSERLGVSVEALQELQFVAQQNGLEQGELDQALTQFSRRVADAARGTGEAKDALRQLNVQLLDASGRLRPVEELLGDVADGFARVEDPAERVRLSVELFSRGGAGLIPVLKGGSAALREMRAEARATGQVLSEETVTRLAAAQDKAEQTAKAIRNNLIEAFASLSPVLTTVSQGLLAFAENLGRITAPLDQGNLRREIRDISNEIERLQQLGANRGFFESLRDVGNQRLNQEIRRLEAAREKLRGQIQPFGPELPPEQVAPSVGLAVPLSKEELAERKRVADGVRELVNELNAEGKRQRDEELEERVKNAEKVRALVNRLNEEGAEQHKKEIEAAAELARERAEQIQAFSDRIAGRILEGGELSFKRLAEAFEREFVQRALSSLINSGLTNLGGLLGGAAKGEGGGAALAAGLLKGIGVIGGFAGFFADGGRIPAGRFGVVGERGPEFVSGPATVTPGGGSGVIVQVITDQPSDRVQVVEAGRQAGRDVVRVIVGDIKNEFARGTFDSVLRTRFRVQPRTT